MAKSFYGTFFPHKQESNARIVRVGYVEVDVNEQIASDDNFADNSIDTAKYNLFTFIPKSLFEQFRRVANLYFLGMSILMIIGTYTTYFDSPLTPWSTLVPLILVLAITMTKEGVEDLKRHRSDALINCRIAEVLSRDRLGEYIPTKWLDIRVGDIVRVKDRQEIPADMILLTTCDDNHGMAYVETANIDGETNLKIKHAAKTATGPKATADSPSRWQTAEDLHQVELSVECDVPNAHILSFEASLTSRSDGEIHSIGFSNFFLRGSSLRNTKWALGLVVYTGNETKIIQNSRDAPSKLSSIEHTMNLMIFFIFSAQIVLTTVSLIAYVIWKASNYDNLAYLCYDYKNSDIELYRENCEEEDTTGDVGYWFTFLILFNNFIPISLYVTVEMVNYVQAYYIDQDLAMYDEVSDTPAVARTSNMNGEIGQIEYIFSDKTGTLTRNEMKFRRCVCGGKIYGSSLAKQQAQDMDIPDGVQSSLRDTFSNITDDGEDVQLLAIRSLEKGDSCEKDLLRIMSVCHTVIVESTDVSYAPGAALPYQAESPDEEALVSGAASMGHQFCGRDSRSCFVDVNGIRECWEVLAIVPFSSTRKRMTAIVRSPDKKDIWLFSKGADNVMIDRCNNVKNSSIDKLAAQLYNFSSDGLRTLVFAQKRLEEHEFNDWYKIFHAAEVSIESRTEKMGDAANLIEVNWTIIGASAIEDKLQDGVPQAIADLQDAGIKIWVLTGDKMETAINIGYSCRLLQSDMHIFQIQDDKKGEPVVHKIQKIVDDLTKITESSGFWSSVMNQLKVYGIDADQIPWVTRFLLQSDQNEPRPSEQSTLPDPLLESFKLLQKSPDAPPLDQLSSDNLALVIDGPALSHVFGDSKTELLFLQLACLCKAVIACRVSPAQKQLLVRLVKYGVHPNPITLAIGDGANDVGMIQEAHIGVGISGKEGRQAVNSSDFAIAQFRFLARLVLLHGRWNYRRICKVVLYSFYKNVVLTLILFYYCFFTGFSGQSLFEDLVYGGFNFFLAMPVVCFGSFDQDVSSKTALRFKSLYQIGREKMDMNLVTMSGWVAQAFLNSIILFFLIYGIYNGSGTIWSSDGKASDLYVFGLVAYSCMLLAMLFKAALCTFTWNGWVYFFWFGSLAFYLVFIFIYDSSTWLSWPFFMVATEMFKMSNFWASLTVITATTLLIDLFIAYCLVEFKPDIGHHAIYFDRDIDRRLSCFQVSATSTDFCCPVFSFSSKAKIKIDRQSLSALGATGIIASGGNAAMASGFNYDQAEETSYSQKQQVSNAMGVEQKGL